ncbi:MAG: dihydroorotase [Selenomonadaceae bacterium]|nr:dihydroorotase [Selenomonadaceae bacterium]
MMTSLIKNGRVIDPKNNIDKNLDILIENDKIKAIGENIDDKDANVIDATNKVVTPGFIDMHVHLREPGQEAKEDFISGSHAAVAGGYTRVATMPNTNPVVDTAALVRSLTKRGEEAKAHIEIIGAVTKGQKGEELSELGDMTEAGAIAFSDDGHYIDNSKILLNALDYLAPFNKVIISHAEETNLVEGGVMNEGVVSARLGLAGRPSVAEDIAVMRDILLAEYANARIHIAHISSKNAVEIVRAAKKKGIKVTAEVTPQHLTMIEDMVDFTDSSTKINPPIRTAKDRDALLEGLLDGTIDMIVTDHSPHAPEEKDREYIFAPSGFPGLETAFGVLYTELCLKEKIELSTVIERMTAAPARVFGIEAGNLAVGSVADITVLDLNAEWTVDDKAFFTRGSHSPFVGKKLSGKPYGTIVSGKIAYWDGKIC